METALEPNEHLEDLNGRLRLIVSPAHTFGTDALLLAAFSLPAPNAVCCDLGTGCGVIPFYWLSRGVRAVWGVELQPDACEQARRSIRLNGLENRFTLKEGDLRDMKDALPFGGFDTVSMNPPFTKTGHGIQSRAGSDAAARHETTANLPEICRSGAGLLKPGGRFFLCMRPQRLAETFSALEAVGLAPKRLQFVSHRSGKAPWLFLLESRKGGRPGLKLEPEFRMVNDAGAPTPEARAVYSDYEKERRDER